VATIDDIGTPGSPLSTPPLTEWQDAVRDKFNLAETWTSWTPTLSGFTASVLACAYTRRGTLVTITVKATVATVTGDVMFTLPVNAHADQVGAGWGAARCVVAASTYHMFVYCSAVDKVSVRVGGTNGLSAGITASVPGVWTAGNTINFTVTYRSV
jgi:hypothetical protein